MRFSNVLAVRWLMGEFHWHIGVLRWTLLLWYFKVILLFCLQFSRRHCKAIGFYWSLDWGLLGNANRNLALVWFLQLTIFMELLLACCYLHWLRKAMSVEIRDKIHNNLALVIDLSTVDRLRSRISIAKSSCVWWKRKQTLFQIIMLLCLVGMCLSYKINYPCRTQTIIEK